MVKTASTPATAAGSNVKAIDYAAMGKALDARVNRADAAEAARLAQTGEKLGGFVGHLRTAKLTAPTIDELLVWTPLRPDDMKPGKDKSNAFNDVMESIHHDIEPQSSAITLLGLNELMNLASHASKPGVVDRAHAECSDVTMHSASRSKEADIKTSAAALAALQARKALLDASNSAPDWAKADVARALEAVDKPGHLAAFGRELGRRRKQRTAYFARMYLAHVGGEIQATCDKVGATVGYYWHRAVLAARSAHAKYLTDNKGKATAAGLSEAMRVAAHDTIAVTQEKKDAAAVTIKVRDKDLKGDAAKRAALKLATHIIEALDRLKDTFPAFYKVDPNTHDEMIDTISTAAGMKVESEVKEELDAAAQEKAQRAADAKAVKPAKVAKQASEAKAAKKVEPAPKPARAPGMPRRKPVVAAAIDDGVAVDEGASVLADLGDS